MENKSRDEQAGYDFTKGAISYLAQIMILTFLVFCVSVLLLNSFDSHTDNSDYDGWNRSGFRIHTDALTGVQYISVRAGGLTPRVDADGNIIVVRD